MQANPFEQVMAKAAEDRRRQMERYAESRIARREQIRAEAAGERICQRPQA